MTKDKDLKRLVRARMARTGESYTAARAQLTRRNARSAAAAQAPDPGAGAARASAAPDLAALAGMSDAKVKEKTGCTWASWVRALDRHGAEAMKHGEIAALVSGKWKVDGWWSQSVTVGYERIKGLRARGQRRDGSYEASKSRTFPVPVAELFEAWKDPRRRRRWLDEDGVRVRTATAPKSIRLGWPDGTIVAVWFTAKGAAKSVAGVQHTKLPDRAAADRLKRYWSGRLDALAALLPAR